MKFFFNDIQEEETEIEVIEYTTTKTTSSRQVETKSSVPSSRQVETIVETKVENKSVPSTKQVETKSVIEMGSKTTESEVRLKLVHMYCRKKQFL